MDRIRELRSAGYAGVQPEEEHRPSGDPIVALSDYSVVSQSYYPRKNVTGDSVPGVLYRYRGRPRISAKLIVPKTTATIYLPLLASIHTLFAYKLFSQQSTYAAKL